VSLLSPGPSWPWQDEARIQKVTKRLHTLEEVNNNVKLLHEMLLHYNQEHSSEADRELMKVGGLLSES
jgi:ADP-ribosylation factor-binding protein GGA